MKRILGFSREEFQALSWYDQRMYAEEYQEFSYQEQLSNWRSGGKKGAPPVHPRERAEMESQKSEESTSTKDIFDLGIL